MGQQTIDLEPNEQLAEIKRRTTDDGYVEVDFVSWTKVSNSSSVKVVFESVDQQHTAVFDWPSSYDDSNEFVALIEKHTPYTMMTAEQINEDDDVRLLADPDDWSLVINKQSKTDILKQKLSFDFGTFVGPIIGFVLFPLTVLYRVLVWVDWGNKKKSRRHTVPDDAVADSKMQAEQYAYFAYGAVTGMIWLFLLLLFI